MQKAAKLALRRVQFQHARSSPSALGKLAIRSNCFEAAQSCVFSSNTGMSATVTSARGVTRQEVATFDMTPLTSAPPAPLVSPLVAPRTSRTRGAKVAETGFSCFFVFCSTIFFCHDSLSQYRSSLAYRYVSFLCYVMSFSLSQGSFISALVVLMSVYHPEQ